MYRNRLNAADGTAARTTVTPASGPGAAAGTRSSGAVCSSDQVVTVTVTVGLCIPPANHATTRPGPPPSGSRPGRPAP